MGNRKTKSVFIVGTKLWSRRLALQLSSCEEFKTVDIYDLSIASIWKLLGLFKYDYMVRVGVRPGVLRPRGVLVDLACYFAALFGVKIIVYWIGSDVHKTLAEFNGSDGAYHRFWLGRTRRYSHAAGAPWLSKELAELGIRSETLYFPSPLHVPEHMPLFPSRFTVLSYIPDKRHEFYGGPEIYECAKRNPAIDFNIVAGSGEWVSEPLPNLNFLGWIDNIEDYYASSVVVARIVEHDALGATVREGWVNGRYVIYTYKIEHVLYVRKGDTEALDLLLRQLKEQFDNGNLGLDEKGYEYAKQHFDPATLGLRFIEKCMP